MIFKFVIFQYVAYLGDTTARGSFDCVIKNMQDGNTTNYMSEVSAIGVYM